MWIIGAPPQLDRYNFSPYISKYEGSNLTLVTKIISDLPLSSGDVLKWVRLHQPFPLTAVVDNYTIYEVLYSRLSLYELSFEDDSGNYTNIVSNQCGTTSVSVYIDVRKGRGLLCYDKLLYYIFQLPFVTTQVVWLYHKKIL